MQRSEPGFLTTLADGASSRIGKLKPPATVVLTREEADVLRLVLADYILTREQRPVFASAAAKLRLTAWKTKVKPEQKLLK